MARTRSFSGFSFSIRALLCVVLVSAVLFALYGSSLLESHRERVGRHLIKRLGGEMLPGEDGRIVNVMLPATAITQRDLRNLS